MDISSQNVRKDITGSTHAVFAACLSALVMIAVLLSPTVSATIWGAEDAPENRADQVQEAPSYQSINGHIVIAH